jgi:iron complex outermembrane receptor protein
MKLPSPLLALLCLPASLFASDDISSMDEELDSMNKELSWLQEETTVISASRVIEDIKKSAASVSIIDKDKLRAMAPQSIWELLKTLPGLGIQQSRLPAQKVESRGIQTLFSEKVLFMIDEHSMDLNLVNGGAPFYLNDLPLEHIERIEVVRGPSSAIYGANAFAAVIHIITTPPTAMEESSVVVSAGKDATYAGNLKVLKKIADWGVRANFMWKETDGYQAKVASDVLGNTGKTDNRLESADISLRLGNRNIELMLNHHIQKSASFWGFTGALTDESDGDMRSTSADLRINQQMTEALNVKLRGYYDHFDVDNYWELFPENTTLGPYTYPEGYNAIAGVKNEKRGIDVTTQWKTSIGSSNQNHLIVSGFNYEHQNQSDVVHWATFNPLTNEPNNPPQLTNYSDDAHTWAPDVDREFLALYIEDLWDITERWRLSTGLRHDYYSDFGGTTNPRLGTSWQFTDALTFKAAYGEAFRAPSFAELYNINNPAVVGNRELTPEHVASTELGIYIAPPNSPLGGNVTLFHNNIDELIEINGGSYLNQGSVKTRGLEAQGQWKLPRGSYFQFNYTFTDARNQSDDFMSNIPRHRGNLMANWRTSSKLNLFWNTYIQGTTQRMAIDSRDELAGYAISNLTMRYSPFTDLTASLRLHNLFDKSYSHPSDLGFINDDYQQPGRHAHIELRYGF